MRAMVLTADNEYRLTDLPEPVPGEGEVAVRVAFAGVQWGDVLVRQGYFPVPRPFVPGFEASGHIVAVGSGVSSARIGEPVVSLTNGGAFAEVVVASSVLTVGAGNVPLRNAGGFGWITPTAYDLIYSVARLSRGESVLIHAADGGVGRLAGQFARLAGAQRIVGVVGKREQANAAKRFGYTQVVERAQFAEELREEKFDLILDPIGGPTRVANATLLAPHGRLVVYGNIATFEPVNFSANDFLAQGSSLLTYNSHLLSSTHPDRLAASARTALELVARGQVSLEIAAEYALSELEAAVQRLADGSTHGKSVVRVSH